jgi:hypothetical protein
MAAAVNFGDSIVNTGKSQLHPWIVARVELNNACPGGQYQRMNRDLPLGARSGTKSPHKLGINSMRLLLLHADYPEKAVLDAPTAPNCTTHAKSN